MSLKARLQSVQSHDWAVEGATFSGQGPLMRAVHNRWQTQFDRYHYKFTRGGTTVHVIWKIGAPETVEVPVEQPT